MTIRLAHKHTLTAETQCQSPKLKKWIWMGHSACGRGPQSEWNGNALNVFGFTLMWWLLYGGRSRYKQIHYYRHVNVILAFYNCSSIFGLRSSMDGKCWTHLEPFPCSQPSWMGPECRELSKEMVCVLTVKNVISETMDETRFCSVLL